MFRPELSAGVELSSAKADTANTERQSIDIVIRFMFIVGRRRMAARLETELILSVVPFSIKSLTLQANYAAGCRCRYVVASALQCFMLGFLRGTKSHGLLLLSTRELLRYKRWMAFAEDSGLGIFLTCHCDRLRKRERPA